MERFERRVARCKKQIEKRPENIIRMRPILKEIMREITTLRECYIDCTGIDIREKMMEGMNQQILKYCKIGGKIVGTQIQILALQHIKRNLNEYKEYFKECQKRKLKAPDKKYPEEIEGASKLLVEELAYGMQVQGIQETEENFSHFINQKAQTFLEDRVKDSYIELLQQAGDFFKRYHLLEKYNQINSREMAEIGIRDFRYPVTKKEKEQGDSSVMAIEECFETEYLRNLGIKELTFINAYWQNRFSKAKELVNRCFYIVDEFNLWEQEGEEVVDEITKEQIEESLIKRRVLETVLDEILEDVTKGRQGGIHRSVNQQLRKNKEGFKEEFDGDLREEIELYIGEMADNCNIYKVKSENIYALLVALREDSEIKNWGVIVEGNTPEKVLIGIDYPGYNMPVGLHVKREELIKWMQGMKQECIFQKYEGNDDFFINGRQMSTNILMPESEEQKQYLIRKASQISEGSSDYRILNHMAANAKGDLPLHLKEVTKNDRGVTFIKRNKRYVKLMRSGNDEICIKDKRGVFVKYEGEDEVPR